MTNNKEEINTEVKEEKVVEAKKTAPKKATPVEKKSDAKDAEIADLKKQLADLNKAMVQLMAQNKEQKTIINSQPKQYVTVVYMSDSLGYFKAGNTTLRCTRFGERFMMNRVDFDQLVGEYRSFFDRGVLAVAPEDIDIAAAKQIKTSDEYALTEDKLKRIGIMSARELENLWNTLETDSHKLTLVQYFKRKFMEGKEPGFQDREKIDLLNRLTKGGLRREQVEVSGMSLKIAPKDFI